MLRALCLVCARARARVNVGRRRARARGGGVGAPSVHRVTAGMAGAAVNCRGLRAATDRIRVCPGSNLL